MNHNTTKQNFRKNLAVLLLILLSSITVKAQRSGLTYGGGGSSNSDYGIALNADYDVPVGNLATTFKATPAFGLSFLHYGDNIIVGASIGYHAYQPKQSVFNYAVTDDSFGTIKYQNFTAVEFYISGAYSIDLSDEVKVYGGLNMGVYYTHLAYSSSDQYVEDISDIHDKDLYIAPKIGLTYMVTENIGIGLEAKYNFFAPTGNTDENSSVGTLYKSYAGGLILTYNF